MKIEPIDNFTPRASHTYFFDSNVWLYLLLPQDNPSANRLIDRYSKFSDQVLKQECLILTNLIQMSELINVILQKEYRTFTRKGGAGSFKDYRASEAGKPALEKARTFVSRITRLATMGSGVFNNDEMKAIVHRCDVADFNDLYFVEYCIKQSAILVTHDFDFRAVQERNLHIVSGNRKYFSQ